MAVVGSTRTGRGAEALRTLGYSESEIAEIEAYAVGHGNLNQAPGINPGSLKAKGFTDEKLAAIEGSLGSAFDIKFIFNQWTLGVDFLKSLGVTDENLAGLGESDDRGRGARAFGVRDDGGLATFQNGHHGVGGAQVDSDRSCHVSCSCPVFGPEVARPLSRPHSSLLAVVVMSTRRPQT